MGGAKSFSAQATEDGQDSLANPLPIAEHRAHCILVCRGSVFPATNLSEPWNGARDGVDSSTGWVRNHKV